MRHLIGLLSAEQKKQALAIKKETSALLRHFRSNASRDEALRKAGEPDSEFHRIAAELMKSLREKGEKIETFMKGMSSKDIPKDLLDLYADLVANNVRYSNIYPIVYTATEIPIPRIVMPPTREQVAEAATQLQETKEQVKEYDAAQAYFQDIRERRAQGRTVIADPYAVLQLDYLYGQFVNRAEEIEEDTKERPYGEVPQATWDEYFLLITAIANYKPLKENT